MRLIIVVIIVILTGSIRPYAQSQQFIKDTLAVRMILDSCKDSALSAYGVWGFIKKAPWLTNQPDDTAGGRIRSLSFLHIPVLNPAIGALDGLENLFLGGIYNPSTGTFSKVFLPPELFILSNLKRLRFAGMQLDSLPAAIGLLKNLEVLDVSKIGLSSIPAEIGNLQLLQSFILSFNNLSRIPETIGNLQNLTYLELHSNTLDSLPHEIGDLVNLNYGEFSENRLKSIPMEIGRLSKLIRLYLGHNNLTTLPDSIVNSKALLSLDSNYLCSLSCRIQSHLDSVQFDPSRPWRYTQRCTVIPVPPCNNSIIRAIALRLPDNRPHGPTAIYDIRGRFIGVSQNGLLPGKFRAGIYILKSTASSGKKLKLGFVK